MSNSFLTCSLLGLLWKVYSSIKKSSKEEASVFILEKKILDKVNKRDRELILDIFRKGVYQLTKLKHPSILKIQHPLEESRESLAFATEPLLASLSNLLGNVENIKPIPNHLESFEFYDVEIKYGLLQISEALAFLHTDAKLLHHNICPEVIMVSKKGAWKLAGFDFCIQPINANDFPLKFTCINITNLTSDYSLLALPNLDFIAPEYLSNSSLQEPVLTFASDMFAFGTLICAIFNKGKSLVPNSGNLGCTKSSRVDQISNLSKDALSCLPFDFRELTLSLLKVDPNLRPDAHQFIKQNIFEDILVRSLQYLDTLFQFDNLERSKFYKGLPEIMKSMSKRIKLNRVFSCIINEFINPDMVPFVLPIVFEIAQETTNEEFYEIILPSLLTVFPMKEPVQISVILMDNMELLLNKCKNHQDLVKSQILPMFCSTLENDNPHVAQLGLKTLPTVAHLIEQSSMKNAVIPRVKKLCINSGQLSIKVNCLFCIAKLLPFLDKWIVIDDIISFFPSIKSKEPAIIMAIIGIYKLVLENTKLGLTKEVMANKVIPFLVPLSIENGLNSTQFSSIMAIIKEMISLIEKEHKSKLEQLDDIKSQQSQALIKYQVGDVKENKDFDGFQSFQSFQPSNEPKEPKAIEYNKTKTTFSAPLAPLQAPTSTSFSKTQPKDLTSSLINSNLDNLCQSNLTPQRHQIQPTVNYNIDKSSFTDWISNYSYNSNFNSPNVAIQSNSQPIAAFQSSHPVNQPRSNYNFSSLDNLNILGVNKESKGPSLNSMSNVQSNWSNTAILITSNSTSASSTNASNLNKLSETDLKEFLS